MVTIIKKGTSKEGIKMRVNEAIFKILKRTS